MKWFAIGGGVDVLGGILQEIERGGGRDGSRPGSLGDVRFIRHKHNHPDPALSGNRQRLIQPQLMLCVHHPGSFDRVHDEYNVADRGQKTSFSLLLTSDMRGYESCLKGQSCIFTYSVQLFTFPYCVMMTMA
jgi:hypothetical protein